MSRSIKRRPLPRMQRRGSLRSLERLEDRLCLSVFYDFDVIAQTGQNGITSILPAASINDAGKVAFVASTSAGQSVWVGDGGPIQRVSSATPQSTITYGPEIQINNSNQVAAVSIISVGAQRRARIWDANNPGSSVIVASSSTPRLSTDHFDGLGDFASMTNDGKLAFAGLESPPVPDPAFWEVHLSGSFVDRRVDATEVAEYPIPPNIFFRQMGADNGSVVIGKRAGTTTEILLDSVGGAAVTIASTAGGAWTSLGIRPGISDDGQIVTFYGNESVDADGDGVTGAGIFASIDRTAGGRALVRITKPSDGLGFSTVVDSAVSVNSTQGPAFGQRGVTIAYLGERSGVQGLYTTRLSFFGDSTGTFTAANPRRFGVSPPTLVLKVGDELFNDLNGNGMRDASESVLIAGTVAGISIRDAVNNRDRGDLAFRVDLGGTQGIVRARPQEVIYLDFAPQTTFATALSSQAQTIFNLNLGVTSPGFVGDIGQVFSVLAPSRPELNGAAHIATIQQDIATKVQQAFAAVNVNVRVVTSAPVSNDFMHVFIGDGAGLGGSNQGLDGISTSIDFFNQDLFDFDNPTTGVVTFQPAPDIAAIFVDNTFRQTQGKFTDGMGNAISLNQTTGTGTISQGEVENAIANIIVHEAGHNLGLLHLHNMPNTFVMNSLTDPDEFRSLEVFGTSDRPIDGSTATQNDQKQLRFAVGTDDDTLTRPLPGALLANLFGRSTYKVSAPLSTSLAVVQAVVGLVPWGDHDLIPEVIDLGGGELATLLDTEIEVRNGDQVFVLASTDGNGIDVFGIPSGFVGDISQLNVTSVLGLFTDDRIRGELFNAAGQPTAVALNLFHQPALGVPVQIGTFGAPEIFNQPPVAADDLNLTTAQGVPVVIDVLANDSDPDGTIDATTVVIVSVAGHGMTSVDPTTGAITYTPAADYVGDDYFSYKVSDDLGAESNVATVSVSVGVGVSFQVTNTLDAGPGSLRQAIVDANATPGVPDTIVFDIPGPGPHAIQLASPLPALVDAATFEIAGETIEIGTFSAFELDGFPGLTKTGDGTLVLGGVGSLGGQSLSVVEGTVQLAAGGGLVLVVDALAVDPAATLDLADNDLVVRATAATRNAVLADVTALVASGANGLAWTGTGICSSTAAADPDHLTALGVMLNDDGLGGAYHPSFSGQVVDANCVLVKYTYYGDADLSGSVDGTDYALTDNGFNSGLGDWFNGDFNYSAVVDGTDYALVDNAFNSQSGPLAGSSPAGLGPIPRAASGAGQASRGNSRAAIRELAGVLADWPDDALLSLAADETADTAIVMCGRARRR